MNDNDGVDLSSQLYALDNAPATVLLRIFAGPPPIGGYDGRFYLAEVAGAGINRG